MDAPGDAQRCLDTVSSGLIRRGAHEIRTRRAAGQRGCGLCPAHHGCRAVVLLLLFSDKACFVAPRHPSRPRSASKQVEATDIAIETLEPGIRLVRLFGMNPASRSTARHRGRGSASLCRGWPTRRSRSICGSSCRCRKRRSSARSTARLYTSTPSPSGSAGCRGDGARTPRHRTRNASKRHSSNSQPLGLVHRASSW